VARQRAIHLSRFELEIMEILWTLGEASVREIREAIQERRRPAYTTVQTILSRLEEKGAVRRTRKIGNALLFEPLIAREPVYRRIIDDFLGLFGGSAQPLVGRLLETGQLTLEDLKALEERHRTPQEGTDKPKERGKKR
jgi:BlaI family transcriptional regulator, penicillinase repressor